MATTRAAAATISTPAPPVLRNEKGNFKWVKLFALIGGLWLAMFGYSAARWLLGGFAEPVPKGPDSVPGYMKFAVYGWIMVQVALVIVAVYFFLYRPWRRDRRLSADGFYFLALMSMWIQDPASNYSQLYFAYNGVTPNLGCPQCFMPGWQGPQLLAEGLFALLWYLGISILSMVLGGKVLQYLQRRWPRWGNLRLVGVLFLCAVIFDFLTEAMWVIPGVYFYTGAAGPGPTLFAGEYFQLPIIEVVCAGFFYTSLVCLRYFKNDKGQTIAERGLEFLRGSTRSRSTVRLLALVGGCNMAFFLSYNVPMDWVGRHYNHTAKEFYDGRSYFLTENCGPGTQLACPDKRLPMRDGYGTSFFTPDGKTVAPNGIPNQTALSDDGGEFRVLAAQDPGSTPNNVGTVVMGVILALTVWCIRRADGPHRPADLKGERPAAARIDDKGAGVGSGTS